MNPDKTAHADNAPTSTDADGTRGQVSHDEVSRRAEQLWRERGSPSGQDETIWLEAEARLKAEAESRPVAGTESRPYVDEPAKPVRSRTKVQDPTDAAVQTRTAAENPSRRTADRLRNQ